MAIAGKHGVTANTPENIPFGAGTIYKGMKKEGNTWTGGTIVGATNGGSTLTITPEFVDIPVDGANVLTKGLKVKVGESATMDVNFTEMTAEVVAAAAAATNASGVIASKANIADGDYWDNVAFVGKTATGKPIIAVLPNALITSGFVLEGKNKEGSVFAATFTCHADIDSDLDKLPWEIVWPPVTA